MTRTAISPRLAMRTFWSTLGLSSGEAGLSQLHAPVWCLPCRARRVGTIRRLRRDRLDQPLPARRGPRRAPPRAWWRWPTTRPPAGAGSTGAGRRRRGRTCWPRSCSGPRCDGGRASTCARPPWRWPRPTPAARWPGSSRCSSGPTTSLVGGAQAGRGPGRGRVRRAAPWPAVVVGIGINVAWPGPAGSRGRPAWTTLGVQRRGRSTGRVLLERLLGALGAARRRCSTTRRAGAALADEVAPALRHAGPARCGSTLAGEELTGLAVGHRRRRATWWSRRPRGPGRVAAGDVVHLRPG